MDFKGSLLNKLASKILHVEANLHHRSNSDDDLSPRKAEVIRTEVMTSLKPAIDVHQDFSDHLDNLNLLIDEVIRRNDWVFNGKL